MMAYMQVCHVILLGINAHRPKGKLRILKTIILNVAEVFSWACIIILRIASKIRRTEKKYPSINPWNIAVPYLA